MTTASLSEFAAIINRAPSYVTKLKQGGRLVLVEVDGKRRKVVDVEASKLRIEQTESGQHERGREYQRTQRGEQPPAVPEGAEADPEADATKRGTRAFHDNRIAAANADMREMEAAKLKGELVDRADVDFVLNDYGATVRGLLQRLADRLSPQVYPLKTLEETHAAIVEAVDELQRELDETMKRRSAGLST